MARTVLGSEGMRRQFTPRERRASRQRRQQHELIGGDAVLGELNVRLAMQTVISGNKRPRAPPATGPCGSCEIPRNGNRMYTHDYSRWCYRRKGYGQMPARRTSARIDSRISC